jgi:hypothetical protein
MEEHDKTNPLASVDALVDPAPLTIARIALLSRVNSPVLFGHADDHARNVEALYLASVPIADAARSAKGGTSVEDALAWAEADKGMADPREYVKRMVALLDSITAFWKMLPNGKKKLLPIRQRMARRTRRVGMPHLRVGNRIRDAEATRRAARLALQMLRAGAGRPPERHAHERRAGRRGRVVLKWRNRTSRSA